MYVLMRLTMKNTTATLTFDN